MEVLPQPPVPPKINKKTHFKENEKKWTKELMDAGWTAFPSIILEKQKALGLKPIDVNILIYLSTYWWTHDNKPHPAKNTIAQAIGVSPRTVQRRISGMVQSGVLKREYRFYKEEEKKGNRTNRYHFNGLIEKAAPYAEQKTRDIKEKQRRDKIRRKAESPELPELKLISGKS